jgi:hypothetical protein
MLTDVPAGTHHQRIWHELLGSADRDVVVPAGGTVDADFALRAVVEAGLGPPTEEAP